MERVDDPELLDDRQGRVVPELDDAGADPHTTGRAGDEADHQGGRGARHPRVEMMLGDPVPAIAQRLALPGQVDRVAKRLSRARPAGDRHQVKNRKRR